VIYKIETLVSISAVRRMANKVGNGSLGRVVVPINLFDIITVVARKARDPLGN
jgi:hypothetical protein